MISLMKFKNKSLRYPKYLLLKAKKNITHWIVWLVTKYQTLKKKVYLYSFQIVSRLLLFFYQNKKLQLFKTHSIILRNSFLGLAEKYSICLELQGVGYSINKEANFLNLALGFSHRVWFKIPQFLSVNILKKKIEIIGSEFQKVKGFSALLRKCKSPEPYKGKGIRIQGENIILKESKKSK